CARPAYYSNYGFAYW
nr:immunoglobulin heavy chain junction region [Mus musculus]MBK4188964.1 immunoglobulin heavy chain junction region [Mus musculus]MBK4188965.1 immunoglobulin heavy chain junction region [Mus musculus]MBK4188966.1 immunoglobulin heavy chain junction region [Mus musculus]MBK4188967.1 immunoglobulin heavy chain junction region [Mus musculus]